MLEFELEEYDGTLGTAVAEFRSGLCNHSCPTCSSVGAHQRNTKNVDDLEVGEFHPNFCLDSAPNPSAYNNVISIMVCCHAGGGCCYYFLDDIHRLRLLD